MRLCLAVTVFGTGVMESRRRGLGLMQSQKAWSLVISFDEMDNFSATLFVLGWPIMRSLLRGEIPVSRLRTKVPKSQASSHT